MNRRTPNVWTAVLTAIATAASGCARGEARPEGRSPKAVRLIAVEVAEAADATTYSAVIVPNAQVDLVFRVPGYVVDVRHSAMENGLSRELEPGDLVAKGTTLARLRPTDYRAQVDKASGARDEATTGIASAEAVLAEAQAGLAQAQLDYSRLTTLWQQESVTKPAYDGSKARFDAARAKVEAAIAGVTAAKHRAAAAAGAANEAEIALSDTELRAPFDAIVVERRVDVGTLVSPAAPAFTIADLRHVKARFSAPDTALHLFRMGQALPLAVDAFPDAPFRGHVLSIAPAADPKSRSFEITMTIENPALTLRSGMIASVHVAAAVPQRQLRIPIDALVHDPVRDEYLVYGVEQKDGRTVATPLYIRPGPLVGNQVSVLSGLGAGQRIVGSAANLLSPGDVVKEIQ